MPTQLTPDIFTEQVGAKVVAIVSDERLREAFSYSTFRETFLTPPNECLSWTNYRLSITLLLGVDYVFSRSEWEQHQRCRAADAAISAGKV